MAAVRDVKLVCHCVLMCVPALALVLGGALFLRDKVPEIIENEHRRVAAEYRQVAEDLRDGEIPAELVFEETVKRPKRARKMKPGRWDFEPAQGGMHLVWYAVGEMSKATLTHTRGEFDFATLFYFTGGLFTVLFVAILSLINSFKVFREIYLLTGPYPYQGLYMMQHFMNNTFARYDYQKMASAAVLMAMVMVVLIAALFWVEDVFGKDVEG